MAWTLNPHLFFLLEADGLCLWDYKHHRQFVLEPDYVTALQALKRGEAPETLPQAIIDDFKHYEVLVDDATLEATNWGWDALAQIYHVGTEDVGVMGDDVANEAEAADGSNIDAYLQYCQHELDVGELQLFTERDGARITLPEPDYTRLGGLNFWQVLQKRKTCRNFKAQSITQVELSTFLAASFGLIHGQELDEFKDLRLVTTALRKASPASGGLHAEEAYVVVYRVEGLVPGVYHYRPQDHQLCLIQSGDFESEVVDINYQQAWSSGLACGIYLTARFDKIWWKYKHSRAYRVTMLDIGHAGQTALLVATALGLQTWLTAAFTDTRVIELLQLDNAFEKPLHFIGIGHGDGCGIPRAIAERLKIND